MFMWKPVAVATLLAIGSIAHANEVIIDTDGKALTQDQITELKGEETVIFKNTSGTGQIFSSNVSGKEISVDGISNIYLDGKWGNNAFYASNGGKLSISADVIKTISDSNAECNLLQVWEGEMSIVASNFEVAAGHAYTGLYAQRTGSNDGNSSLSLDVENASISGGSAIVAASFLGQVEGVRDGSINIDVNADASVELIGSNYGIRAHSTNTNYEQVEGGWKFEYVDSQSTEIHVSVDAGEKIYVKGEDAAIYAVNGYNGSSVSLKAPIIEVDGNIYADTGFTVSVGDENTQQTTINGDITATGGAQVSLKLGQQGALTGAVMIDSSSLVETSQGTQTFETNASSVQIDFGEGSVWNVTGKSNVSQISGEGSIVITDKQNTVTVTSLDGQLSAGFKGLTSDDFTQKELSEMVQVSKLSDESSLTIAVEEGDIKGAMTVTQTNEGSTYTETENTKLSSFSSVNVTNLLQWRHEMNDLTKRMGELRISPEGVGAWARLYGSEQEYGSTGTETKNTSVQVGADYDVGAGWKVGAAFSYTDSSSSMNNGSADGDMFGLAVYGAWFNDDGQFLDLIAKYSRLSTDFTAGNMSGSYDNNAFSVSAEYGWHFKFNDLAFVEPQAELTYGQVLGDDFTTGNQVRIEQDDVDSLIGRLGVRGGFYFPENKGTIYARASVLHDFDGESSFTATKGESATYTEDMGGTWYEFGIGANFNLTDTTYTYVDLEKSTGGEVKENWRWNVGLRHVW